MFKVYFKMMSQQYFKNWQRDEIDFICMCIDIDRGSKIIQ